MALKFQCKNCGKDIAVRFLKVGEAAECKSCGASNPVPESAEEITDETAKSIAEASVSESAESANGGPTQSQGVPTIAKALRIVGTLSIGFGVIAGIAMLILFSQSVSSSSSTSTAELSLGGVVTALGMTFYFCTLGVLCLGIAKVIELLSK